MAGKKLGSDWKIKKVSETEVSITLPEGRQFTGEELSIDNILETAQRPGVMVKGEVEGKAGDEITLRCCSGNTAIAAQASS